ncbi:hypothetical protein [Streptomyces sp. NPDC048172]|uniref:hypothetical protein n=1 Tax=Streptomyces sp. NPDC048172 TaxID=3365505 RepID=UPI003723D625
MTAVFTAAYEGLTAEQARLYRLLGLYPGHSVDIGQAVCVSGADPETAQELLYALEDAELLEEGEDGRYRFLGEARDHAREQAAQVESDAEREAVLERCVDYYVTGAAFADLAVMGERRLRVGGEAVRRPGAYDPFGDTDRRLHALGWLIVERLEALAVLRAAVEHGGMAHQAWQLAESLTALHLNHRLPEEWVACCALGAEAAAADENPAAEARLRALLSRPLLDLGEEERARAELDRALELADATGDARLRALTLGLDGRYWQTRDADRACAAYESSLALNEQAGDARGAALARSFLGWGLCAAGQFEKAVPELRAAEEALRELEDPRGMGRTLTILGRALEGAGAHEDAVRAYEDAVHALRECQATHYEAEALEALAAWTAGPGGDEDTAREQLARALELYEAGGSPRADFLRELLAQY